MQSSTLLLLACDGAIPRFDYAIFADTGWEPAAVYAHLDRLEEVAAAHHIPVIRISAGNIRNDALDPTHRFAPMPLHVRIPDGRKALGQRQCTSEYKVRPLKRAARQLLGYPHPRRVPKGVYAEQAIGISVDEWHRAKTSGVNYLTNIFPLLDVHWRRTDCISYLNQRGFPNTPKSACLGCPFHSNNIWRNIRDNDPDGWADVVAFDKAIRHGYPRATSTGTPLHGEYFLHSSCTPLDTATLDTPTANTTDDPPGCSPWSCRGDLSTIASNEVGT